MEALHLPDNIKVHFASMENLVQYQIIHTLGVNYFLYTAYPFVSRLLKSRSNIEDIEYKYLRHLSSNCKHVIQDSGVFTLMFGAKKKGKMKSSYLGGAFKDDAQLRNEFFNLIK